MSTFPSLAGLGPTQQTLHLYSRAVATVPRAYAPMLPHWWQIGLTVKGNGLRTVEMELPDGRQLYLIMELGQHAIQIIVEGQVVEAFDMQAGKTGTEMGEALLEVAARLGLEGEYERKRFADDERRAYDPDAAERFFAAVELANGVFERHGRMLEGEVSPVHFWTHGFDMSVEWYGTKEIETEENGKVSKHRSQINLGFSLGEPSHPEPYFYSNPWPLDKEALFDKELPEGARWFSNGWEGSILPYAELEGGEKGEERLLEYAQVVYRLARGTLVEGA